MLSNEALWLAWQRGDPGAFDALYERVTPGLFALCCALTTRARIQPDDLFQEVFRRAIAGHFRPGGALEAWLAVIARNACVDLQRAAKSAPPVPEGVDPSDPGGAAGVHRVDLSEALDRLPAELRETVELRHLQGLTVEEVAAWLQVSPSTVKRRLGEAFRLLAPGV